MNIWKFTVHILLKPDLENFEHYFIHQSIKVFDHRRSLRLRDAETVLPEAHTGLMGTRTAELSFLKPEAGPLHMAPSVTPWVCVTPSVLTGNTVPGGQGLGFEEREGWILKGLCGDTRRTSPHSVGSGWPRAGRLP